jgi:hypothetical protein
MRLISRVRDFISWIANRDALPPWPEHPEFVPNLAIQAQCPHKRIRYSVAEHGAVCCDCAKLIAWKKDLLLIGIRGTMLSPDVDLAPAARELILRPRARRMT